MKFFTALFNRKYLFYNVIRKARQWRGRKICNDDGASGNQSELLAPTDPNQQSFHGNYIRVWIWNGLRALRLLITFIGGGWSEGEYARWRMADDCIIPLRKSRYDRAGGFFLDGHINLRWIHGDMRAAAITSAFN